MSNNHLKVLTLFTYCLDIVVFIIPNFPSVALGLEHLQQFPNTSPYPHKTVILGTAMLFLAPAVPQYLSLFFGGHQYFSHLPSKKGGDTTPPIPWGPSQLSFFSHIFSYTPVKPTFHMGIGEDILWYCYSISPNKSKK